MLMARWTIISSLWARDMSWGSLDLTIHKSETVYFFFASLVLFWYTLDWVIWGKCPKNICCYILKILLAYNLMLHKSTPHSGLQNRGLSIKEGGCLDFCFPYNFSRFKSFMNPLITHHTWHCEMYLNIWVPSVWLSIKLCFLTCFLQGYCQVGRSTNGVWHVYDCVDSSRGLNLVP